MRLDWALLDGWHEVSVALCNSQTSECGTDVPGIAEKPFNMNVMHLYLCISEHSYSSSQRVLSHDAARLGTVCIQSASTAAHLEVLHSEYGVSPLD